ncbi:proton-translocating NADH-quinone oxidoreductase, chain M [Solidesulfovibrio fructosivorans JJ]]|uniref:Proton-translocating NADH-quinone oxidoreductase, chain M n=1 Tax=Solidesulfovibrio fructosivorans JJ] TaxID=596151 RepID=E1JZU6_SOLFR|nr:NADH-quinone oxidoreductase subunit M [Solidesulfovibrio fructosivorans]EFL50126.1 proton-translocating NADH-quinone oxidoreductase, chain M [Solidesulfovibrio fructosivorans JJ]]
MMPMTPMLSTLRDLPWLTLLIFWPLAAAVAMPLFRRSREACRSFALTAALIEGAMALLVILLFAVGRSSLPVSEDVAWIPQLGIRYTLTCDGLSLVFVALTAFIGVCCMLASRHDDAKRPALYHALILASLATVQGVFLATDVFLFALFWEAQLIPVFFLIGIFGHGDRMRVAIKFFLFSAVGGLLMFLAVIALGIYAADGPTGPTFALYDLTRLHLPLATARWLFAAFVLSFAIKIPLVPVHMWLPDAHTEAPTAGSLILAGLLLKTGGYALIRFALPLFPEAAVAYAPVLTVLGLIGLFYASWVALAQEDVKRLVAYSSIGHMGLAVAAIVSGSRLALGGAVVMMVSHGLTSGGLFAQAGMIGERMGSRRFAVLGGLWNKAPRFGAAFLVCVLASAALPGLSGFVGEAMIVFGLFRVDVVTGAFAVLGMAATLVYLLRLARDTLFGPPRSDAPFADLSPRETALMASLILAMLWIGLFPGPVLSVISAPLDIIAGQVWPAVATVTTGLGL